MRWKKPLFLTILFGSLIALVAVALARAPNLLERFITKFIETKNPNLSDAEVKLITRSLLYWAKKRNVNLFSVMAIAWQESWFDPRAVEKDEEGRIVSKGIMQLTRPALDQLVKIGYISSYDWGRLFDPSYNISLGTAYYRYCAKLSKTRREAIARYNRTSEPWLSIAQKYADQVLAKRAEIVQAWEKFKKAIV